MEKTPKSGGCEEFQASLSELIGNDKHHAHPHLLECEQCRALVVDLEIIAEAPRQRKFPDQMP
jgi:hypothetical protein